MRSKRKKAIQKAKQVNQLEKHVKGLIKAVGGVDMVVDNAKHKENRGKMGAVILWVDKEYKAVRVEGGKHNGDYVKELDISDIIEESILPWEGEK